jgi:inhibitor of cysteine peptidase
MEELNMILSAQDSGRTVNMRLGQVITVRLKENPTTGYQWSAVPADGLKQIHDQYEAANAIGAAGVHEFQFRITKVGSHPLQLKHWRTWEGEGSVIGRFVATIIVE